MNANGLSLFNVGTSLDLEALNHAKGQEDVFREEGESEDEGEEENRNAELKDLLTNAFDDLIEDDEISSEMEASHDNHNFSSGGTNQGHNQSDSSNYVPMGNHGYNGNSLYSPIHAQGDLSGSQYNGTENPSSSNPSLELLSKVPHRKHCVRFSALDDSKSIRQEWVPHSDATNDKAEQHYLSSGLNTQEEFKILYAARESELKKMSSQLLRLQHKTALLEAENTGIKVTLESSERVVRETREENRRLTEEIQSLNHRLDKSAETNHDLVAKLKAAESNTITLERQILDLNLFQAHHRDANRQEVLLDGIKVRYENDLRVLRDELNRLRSELDSKNENIAHLERKLREVTEMHERTLTERAANLQEFNRALDQQRMLREQRDSLTSATLLDQLSKAQEEIERLKAERISQNLSDSMAQLRLGFNNKDQRDGGQSDLTISNLEQRLKTSERNGQQLEELVRQLQNEKKDLSDKVSSITEELRMVSSVSDRQVTELNNVKELYLNVCRDKDSLEEQLQQLTSQRQALENQRQQLIKELEDANRLMDESLNRQKAVLEASAEAKVQTAVQEQLARARLEWLKENSQARTGDLASSLRSPNADELQRLNQLVEVLRAEKDALQNELTRRQEQLKLERQLLREKFAVEKEMLIKSWQQKVAAASEVASSTLPETQQAEKSLITATADAMARLRQQFEEEKLSIIANYERQLLDLQANSSTPQQSCSITHSGPFSDWNIEMSKVKSGLKNNNLSVDILCGLDNSIQKMEAWWRRDQKALQDQVEKYKQLKRRVRDYQKYVNDKLSKYKTEREQSEEYCRHVIAELLGKVTHELQQLERDRREAEQAAVSGSQNVGRNNGVRFTNEPFGSTFAQSVDELQQQVNRYVQGLANFTASTK